MNHASSALKPDGLQRRKKTNKKRGRMSEKG